MAAESDGHEATVKADFEGFALIEETMPIHGSVVEKGAVR